MKGLKKAKKERSDVGQATHAPIETSKNKKQSEKKNLPHPSHYREEENQLCVETLLCHEGVAILEWRAVFPLFTTHGVGKREKKGLTRIENFYKKMAEDADAYARGGFFSALVQQYEKDPDPRKKFRHARVRLSVAHTVTQETGRFLSVRRTVCLSRAGKVIFEQEQIDRFDRIRGRICPPVVHLP